jgi:hypothetical protein
MISESDNIPALIITEALRIDYNVNILVDWGYMNWLPRDLSGIRVPNFHCNEWQYGNWRSLNELRWVENGIHLLAAKMGGPAKFKAAMKNRPVEIERVKKLPLGFTDNTGLALPEIPLYFMVDGLAIPDSPFDIGERRATYTTIHELGHVWDIRSNLSFSISMALQLGNAKYGNDVLFQCLLGPADPSLRFACAFSNWEYDATNEPAPGDLTRPYASFTFTEDWAEAVAYTVYPEYGKTMKYNEIGPIRKIFVEMMMRDIQ